jgi:hypothetical protein
VQGAAPIDPLAEPEQLPRKQIYPIGSRLIIYEPPDIERHQTQRQQANRNVHWPVNTVGVQRPKQSNKNAYAEHQENHGTALKDPDTWPTLSCVIVGMQLQRHG